MRPSRVAARPLVFSFLDIIRIISILLSARGMLPISIAHSASIPRTSSRRNMQPSSAIALLDLVRNVIASAGLPDANMHMPRAIADDESPP